MTIDLLNPDTWRFINTFAPWLSAIGTLLAVTLSLHLARRDKTIRLEVSAGHRILVTQGKSGPRPEYLVIKIVNIGHREAQITNIGWKTGILKKQYAVQTTITDGMSNQIPVRLKDGEEANYYIPLNTQTNWHEDFAKKMLMPFPKAQMHFLRVQVLTSIGKTFEASVEKNLKTKLLQASVARMK